MAGPSPQLVPTLHSNLQHYASDAHAPADARRHVRARLTQWGLSSIVEDAEAVTSELVTNAALHGGGGDVMLRLELTRQWVLLRVWDANPMPPVLLEPGPLLSQENGRGLLIVEALSVRWGWYPEGAGKVVWASFGRKTMNGRVRDARAASLGTQNHRRKAMSNDSPNYTSAQAAADLLDEAPCLPADLIEELVLYRGEPGQPADTGKVEDACRQLIQFAPEIPDSLEGELYGYAETLGLEEAIPE